MRLVRSLLSGVVLALSLAQAGLGWAQSSDNKGDSSLASLWASKEAWDAPEPWRTDRWYFQTSYYTWHFHYDVNHKQAIVLDSSYRLDEYWLGGQWIVGLTLFSNSFGQFSQFLYGGLQWRPIPDHQPFYFKVAAGLLHGYEGAYKDKIPLNSSGTAPAIVPGVGYCWTRYCAEAILLGTNAMLFTVGVTLP